MGSFYQGAYASPLQRQATYVDDSAPQFSPDMSGYPATSSLGGSGGGPSRFQSFLGSLSQGSGQQQGQKRKGLLGGINQMTGGTGATQPASSGGALGLLKFLI